MDPDETLKRLRELAEPANRTYADDATRAEWLEEMGVLFQALDEWLTKGGFLPAPWRQDSIQTTTDVED